ncbi:MAG: Gfo/Idh/MocA family oxidoreductase [Armatimonadetes bacterium]|nr:Gfo/Idh/MocA family oxidoreductase [Armatimonadota bacterium]
MALRTLHLGVGGRGVWPVRMFPQRDDLQIAGLCDIRQEALTKARETTGLAESACYLDWQVALRETECEAVIICTPPQLHYPMSLAAVRAGKHVLVEKPFALELGQACEVVREADAAGVKLAVGQQARYSRGNLAAMELLAAGDIGRPEFGLLTRHNYRPGVHHSGAMRNSYGWERAVHDYDAAWSLFGGLPRRVAAMVFNPSWSPYEHGAGLHAVIEFERGATCALSCTFMSHGGGEETRVDCPGGALWVEGSRAVLRRAEASENEVVESAGPRPPAEQMVTDGWLEWIAGGPEPDHGMHRNLWVLAMVEATGVASDEGRTVDLAEYIQRRL